MPAAQVLMCVWDMKWLRLGVHLLSL